MAQSLPKAFDWNWEYKREVTQKLIQSAADEWSMRGRDTLNVDTVLAIILRIFGLNWSISSSFLELEERNRSLKAWIPLVDSLEKEAQRFPRLTSSQEIMLFITELRAVLEAAADQWQEGYPETPPTSEVAKQLEQVLWNHQLVHRRSKA